MLITSTELDLPEYDSYDSLKKALLTACEMGGNYFGFA
jgi:E3 ubiquitin-protein ligase HUWE1